MSSSLKRFISPEFILGAEHAGTFVSGSNLSFVISNILDAETDADVIVVIADKQATFRMGNEFRFGAVEPPQIDKEEADIFARVQCVKY